MMDNVVQFTHKFDATEMTYEQMKQHARDLGWIGIKIVAEDVLRDDRVIVRRMSRKDAFGER